MPQLQFAIDWARLVAGNMTKLRRALDERGIDLLFVNNIDNVRYLTGYSPVSGPGLVHSNWVMVARATESRILFGFSFYVDSIRASFPWLTDVRDLPASMPQTIAELAGEHEAGRGRIAFDGFLPYTAGKEIERLLPDAELVNADDLIVDARLSKSPQEIEIIERCVAIGEIGMKTALDACVEGVQEYQVAAEAEYAMRSAGAEGFPYSAVVTSGENAAIMQELATDKFLRRGELVMLDLGCMFEGYYCDFARTALVGGEVVVPEQKPAYKAVRDALAAMVESIRPGVSCGTLDEVGRHVLREAGFGEWEPKYSIGHGIGMTHWEPPLLYTSSEVELRPGMILCVEPGLHKPGLGGMRLEEMVLVTEEGNRVLTRTEFCEALL
jgi:Xaa-Pro aminopeptidase